jgi:hypothetical protein
MKEMTNAYKILVCIPKKTDMTWNYVGINGRIMLGCEMWTRLFVSG